MAQVIRFPNGTEVDLDRGTEQLESVDADLVKWLDDEEAWCERALSGRSGNGHDLGEDDEDFEDDSEE